MRIVLFFSLAACGAAEIGAPPEPTGTCTVEICTDNIDNDCNGLTDCDDALCALATNCIRIDVDTDEDGLPDDWESAAGDSSILDPLASDTNDDGTPDGAEDPDNDGLTNLDEYATARMEGPPPHPFQTNILIELDTMADRLPSPAILNEVIAAYAAIPHQNLDGSTGIRAHIYIDEDAIAAFSFDGSFEQRWDFFETHGPQFGDHQSPPIPYEAMVHIVVARERTDLPERTGEAVPEADNPERSGIFVYYDAVDAVMPSCGAPTADPPLPAIEIEEALANTLVHEVGHALQVGHDTETGGGINYYNVMSVPSACSEAQMRFHGWGNDDSALGNTENVAAPRFSHAAAALINIGYKLSVETAELVDVDM